MNNQHQRYMDRCLELAETARAQGESPVGSVIVKDGQIIGEGTEQSRQLKDVSRHAEVMAVLDAVSKGHQLAGATLYSNVEPCLLCSYVIRHHRLGRVVFSKACGELGGTNPRFNLLTTNELGSWGDAPEVIIL
ncbi:nucleoside deaminase [Chitinophaga sp. 22620]|uniref:nucleoside deaminase n=1 Tax=Chitinophaga sp. 22620 TaxID=3453952 RepID=UPI003F82AC67